MPPYPHHTQPPNLLGLKENPSFALVVYAKHFAVKHPYSVFQRVLIWGKRMLQRGNGTFHACSWAILKRVKHAGKCSMDFIAKHHGAVISFLAGNGNVYSYKHNGVEHHLISIQMPPSTEATHTQMPVCSPHSSQQPRLPNPHSPRCCPAAQWAIEPFFRKHSFTLTTVLKFVQFSFFSRIWAEGDRKGGLLQFFSPHKHVGTTVIFQFPPPPKFPNSKAIGTQKQNQSKL